MTESLQYDEPATLMAYGSDRLVPHKTEVTTLAEAVRRVVEEWSAESVYDVFIATTQGPVQGLEAVRAIYLREDFPLPRIAL